MTKCGFAATLTNARLSFRPFPNDQEPATVPILHRRLLWILAVACGVTVANLYYNQPLLAEMARSLHVPPQRMGWVAMLTQVGYAGGMLLFVPLADLVQPRRLVLLLLCAVTVALIGVAL